MILAPPLIQSKKRLDGLHPAVKYGLNWQHLPLLSTLKRYKFYTIMGFEFDPQKSEQNRAKHGIDFVDAQQLWNDSNMLEIPARTEDEQRSIIIGKINVKHWSAVITYRGNDIRIISVRRSRVEEVALYES